MRTNSRRWLFDLLPVVVLVLAGCPQAGPPVPLGTASVWDVEVAGSVDAAEGAGDLTDGAGGSDPGRPHHDLAPEAGPPDLTEDLQQAVCGNAVCEPGENPGNCLGDCGPVAGDGICDDAEDCLTTPEDCGLCCGDGVCNPQHWEQCNICSQDCGACCGNGFCDEDFGEGCGSCPEDCFGEVCCGDSICTAFEQCGVCLEDCGECPPVCGDGIVQTEQAEECDDGNLEAGDGCTGQCTVEPQQAAPGDIIITEIMKDPQSTEDTIGEWFEVHNTTDQSIDLNGWELQDEGVDHHEILSADGVVVPAQDYFVLARHVDTESVAGVPVGYVYSANLSSFNLANKDDEIILVSGDVVVDAVYYDNGEEFPDAPGKASSLDPEAFDPVANDIGSNWCDAQTAFGTGDLGTPGNPNPDCPAEP